MVEPLLTEKKKLVYSILKSGEKLTKKDISKKTGLSKSGVERAFATIRKMGITIERFQQGERAAWIFWIDEVDFEDEPLYKKKYKDSEEFGKEIYKPVKDLARSLTNKSLVDIPNFHFTETIGIVFWTDWHLGHKHVDYGAAEDQSKMVGETEGLYVVTIGDMIDNSENVISPTGSGDIVGKSEQLSMLEYLLMPIRDKILIMYEGNHEIRSFISDNFMPTEYMAKGFNAEYGRYGGLFKIDMNNTEIQIYCRHKCKGHSQYNPLHPLIRCILFDFPQICYEADILVRGHTHERACGVYRVGHKDRYMAVGGNLAVYDDYADRVGFHPAKASFPMVIIRKNGSIRLYPRVFEGIQDLKIFRMIDSNEESPSCNH